MSLEVNPFVEVFAAGDWQDATADVFTANGTQAINITTGNQGMNAVLGEPSQMTCTFMSWDWWPDNAAGPYYGYLDINTPIRAGVGLVDHEFPGTVVDGWSDVGGLPVTNTGLGGVVAASDFQQTPGVGTHSVPGAGQHRKSVVQGQDQGDGEQYVEFRLPTANITGAGYEPANLIHRWIANDDYLMLRLVALPDETITLKFLSVTFAGDVDRTDVFTSPLTNTGQWIAVKTNVEDDRVQAKVWAVDVDPEPLDWTLNEPINGSNTVEAGGIGIRTGVETGNTNASPKIVEYRNLRFRSVQFYGGISDYPPEPVQTEDGDVQIPIVANGPSRRFAQGQLPVVSALGRALPLEPGTVALWPCEDAEGSTEFASALPGHLPMVVRRGAPDFASYSDLDSTKPLVSSAEADWIGDVVPYTHTGVIQLRLILQPPSTPLSDLTILIRLYTDQPGATLWQLVYRTASGGSLEVQAWKSETEGVYANTTGETGLDGVTRMISLVLEQDGADVDVHTEQYPFIYNTAGSDTDHTATGLTLASVKRVWVNPQLRDNIVFGYIHVQNQRTDLFDIYTKMFAYVGEGSLTRLERVLDENGITFTKNPVLDFGDDMGPQGVENVVQTVEKCITLDSGGMFYDGKTHDGCKYIRRKNMYNQADHVAVDYAQLFDTFRPRRDDRDVRNIITVTRDGGSSATFALETGRRSILPPKDGGIGEYPSSVTVNKYVDTGLVQIAAWRVHALTVDEPRYTEATIECSSPLIADDAPEVRRRLLDLRPGHVLSVANAEKIRAYSTIRQRVAGHSQEITQFRHSFTMNTIPAAPYNQVFTPAETDLSGGEYARADSRYSTLENAITSGATSFTVAANSSTLWIDTATHAGHFPFIANVGGEELTVTGITTVTPTFVAAGAAAAADNASIIPGLPAGATQNDLLITFAAGRDFGNVLSTASSGWTVMWSLANIQWFWKVHGASEAAGPTIDIGGTHAAGDTMQAQMIALRNCPQVLRASAQEFNGSAQNIFYPTLYSTMSKSILITAGWKQDDWTSVAALSGYTEIGEPASTLGNDQGLVWDYKAVTGEVANPFGSFVVTGGAAASSRGMSALFGNWQIFTVTRGPNARAHDAGVPVRAAAPNRTAL